MSAFDIEFGLAMVGVGVIWLVVSLAHHEGLLGARIESPLLLRRVNEFFWLLLPRLGLMLVVAGSCVVLVDLIRR